MSIRCEFPLRCGLILGPVPAARGSILDRVAAAACSEGENPPPPPVPTPIPEPAIQGVGTGGG
eukprot:3497612-Pyramimonas_sp.AAC.1